MTAFHGKTGHISCAAIVALFTAGLGACASLDTRELEREITGEASRIASLFKANSDMEFGKSQYHSKNYEAAEFYMKKTLLVLPDDILTHKLLAWSQFFQKRYDKAYLAFQQTHALYPKEPDPVIGTGWSYFGLKNYEKAIETFNRASEFGGDPYQIDKGKAFSYLKLQDVDKAREEFSKIYSPDEIELLMAKWQEWTHGEPDATVDLVSSFPGAFSIFTLELEKPRYRSVILAYQTVGYSKEIDEAWGFFKSGIYVKAAKKFGDLHPDQSLDAANGLAWSLLRNEKILDAEAVFRNITSTYPDFRGAVEGLEEIEKIKRGKTVHAHYYYDLEKHTIAIKEFKKLGTDFPGWAYPNVNLGIIYSKLGKYDTAHAHFQEVLQLDPNNQAAIKGIDEIYQHTAPILLKANLERRKENYESASWLYADYIENQEKSLLMPTTLAEAYNGLGWSYFGKKQYRLAIDKFQKATDHSDFKYEAVKGLALSYYNIQDYENAAKYLAMTDKIQSNQKDIVYKLDWSVLRSASKKEAEEHFKTVLRRYPLRTSAYMGMGWVIYQKGDPDLAVEYFLKAISIDPDFALTPEFTDLLNQERFGWQVYNRFGWAYYEKQQYPKSVSLFETSLKRNPKSSEAFKGIAYNLFKQKKYREAIASFQRCLDFNRDPNLVLESVTGEDAIAPFEIQTSVRTKLGWTHLLLKQYDEAIAHFNLELEKHPEWSDIYNGLGWTYLKMRRLPEARAAFSMAIKLQPLDNSALKGLNLIKQLLASQKNKA